MNDPNELDEKETLGSAKQWGKWLQHDLRYFIEPMATAAGATTEEVLLYLISEYLGQIAQNGVKVTALVRHDIRWGDEPPPDEGEEWKT